MKIMDLVCSPGRTGFFFDDQRAIKSNAKHDGEFYIGAPVTPGFTSIRQPGESVGVMLKLDDGQIAYGDCCAVQYSGTGGRDPLFLAKDYIPFIEKNIRPLLVGKEADSFRQLSGMVEGSFEKLHTAIGYGISQAILDAVAKSSRRVMAQVVADEYGVSVSKELIPIFSQSGDNRYDNVDKMIIKQSAILPHALINNVGTKLGNNGEKLIEYVRWLRDRILNMRADSGYSPILHIDVYGTIGIAFNMDFDRIISYLAELEKEAAPFRLRIEGAVDAGSRDGQMESLAKITEMLDTRGIDCQMVADEWCNTFEDVQYFADYKAGHIIQIKTPDLGGIQNTAEAVLYCKTKNIGAYQGGTCNETDVSARACTNIAMAVKPLQILAKPGMGVDEGYMIVFNEMQRILALTK